MNRGEEDYLKQIYEIQEGLNEDEYVSSQQLNHRLKHTLATINEMVKKLTAKDFLVYKPYKGVRLTKEGEDIALRMVRKHRIWERFLTDFLHYDWDEVHDEAEVLEHHTSDRLMEAMSSFLKNPEYCPHGNPIPDIHGFIKKKNEVRLDLIVEGDYFLSRVDDERRILKYLNDVNLELGDVLNIIRNDQLNEIILIVKDDRSVMIGYNVAKHLYLTPTKNKEKLK